MSRSPLLTRRSLFTAAAAVAALELRPARAQTTSGTGCTIGFVNGLLQFSPDCPLLAPPALDAEVAPPSHLVTLAQAVDGGTGTTTTEAPQSGSRRQRRAARQHQRRKFARNRRHRRVKRNRAARHRRYKRRH